MRQIQKKSGSVYADQNAWDILKKEVLELQPSKVFVLTDGHTQEYCIPWFIQKSGIENPIILSIPAGEENKTLETCMHVWKQLSQKGADRRSILINLGGGVVTDLGGFVACTYQRGIPFFNIPTSLLAMVDASVGGKNGVDLEHLKNQIGIIKNPEAVIIDIHFLKTLPSEHIRSGQAEMIKHGFIASEQYLKDVFQFDAQQEDSVLKLIWESIEIKDSIITKDPTEKGIRKSLNYGHTLGHAIESYALKYWNNPLLHGEAIAIGMILACYISSKQCSFPFEQTEKYSKKIAQIYPTPYISEASIEEIIKLLIFDKKNAYGKVQFVLLNQIGVLQMGCEVPEEIIKEAFNFYNNNFTE